jgi:hypothetical protein
LSNAGRIFAAVVKPLWAGVRLDAGPASVMAPASTGAPFGQPASIAPLTPPFDRHLEVR